MSERLANALYQALLALLLPLYVLRLWRRGRAEPRYRYALGERFGYYAQPADPGAVWIHAVSLGETRAAAALIAALRSERPGLRLLLTHGTATGREAGRALLQPGDCQAWLPYDTAACVRRFLRHFRPSLGVLMETEVWPRLLRAAAEQRVPVLLANARLSDKSLRKGQRVSALLQPAFSRLAVSLAQTNADAQRLRLAGAGDVVVCGNLKFDMTPNLLQLDQGKRWRIELGRPVVLAASSRDGEEAPLIDAWRGALARRRYGSGAPLLLIVPRHPQRFDEVARLLAATGLPLARRSDWSAAPGEGARTAAYWLGDSLGEMAQYYAVADIALLGGSFAPLGGQNLIEAAACGCPLVVGPHTYNFAEAAEQAIDAGAAFRVADVQAAVDHALDLIGSAECARAAERALDFAAAHRGAAKRIAAEVVRHLP